MAAVQNMILAALSLAVCVLIWYVFIRESPQPMNTVNPTTTEATGSSMKAAVAALSAAIDPSEVESLKSAVVGYESTQGELRTSFIELGGKLNALEKDIKEGQWVSDSALADKIATMMDSIHADMKTNLETFGAALTATMGTTSTSIQGLSSSVEAVDALVANERARLNDLVMKVDAASGKLDDTSTAVLAGTKLHSTLETSFNTMQEKLGGELSTLKAAVEALNGSVNGVDVQTLRGDVLVLAGEIEASSTSISSIPHITELVSSLQSSAAVNVSKVADLAGQLDALQKQVTSVTSSTATSVSNIQTISQDLSSKITDVQKALQELIVSTGTDKANWLTWMKASDGSVQRLASKLQDYIDSQFKINADIQGLVSGLTTSIGDVRSFRGDNVSSAVKALQDKSLQYDGNTVVLQDLISKVNGLADTLTATNQAVDTSKLTGFYSFQGVFDLLDAAWSILKGVAPKTPEVTNYISIMNTTRSISPYPQASDVRAVVSLLQGIHVTSRGLMSEVDNASTTKLLQSADNILTSANAKQLLVDYVGNLQLAVARLQAQQQGTVSADTVANIGAAVSALQLMVGDQQLLGSEPVTVSIMNLQKIINTLNTTTSQQSETLSKVSDQVVVLSNQLTPMLNYNAMIQSLQSDMALLLAKVGAGSGVPGAKDLSAAVANLWGEISDNTSKLSSVSASVNDIMVLLGAYSPINMGGDIANVLQDLSTSLKGLNQSLSYKVDDFDKLTLSALLKSTLNRIKMVEAGAEANRNTPAAITGLLTDVSSLKTILQGDSVTSGVASRVSEAEGKLVTLLANVDSLNSTTEVLTKASAEASSLSTAVRNLDKSLGNLPSAYTSVGTALEELKAATEAGAADTATLRASAAEVMTKVSSALATTLNNSTSITDLASRVKGLETTTAVLTSMTNSISTNTSDIARVSGMVLALQQSGMVANLGKALGDIIQNYTSVKTLVQSRYPAAEATVQACKELVDMLSSWSEGAVNQAIATKLQVVQIGLGDMWMALKSSIDYGANVEPVNQSTAVMETYYLWKYMAHPLGAYNAIMDSWLSKDPIWYSLGKANTRLTTMNSAVDDLSASLKAVSATLGPWDNTTTVQAAVAAINAALANIGKWSPTATASLDPTLVAAVARLSAQGDSSTTSLNSLTAYAGAFKSSDPTIAAQLTQLASNVGDLQKASATVDQLASVKSSVTSLSSVLGTYTGVLSTDIASVNQAIASLKSTIGTLPANSATTLADLLTNLQTKVNGVLEMMLPSILSTLQADLTQPAVLAKYVAGSANLPPSATAAMVDLAASCAKVDTAALSNWNIRYTNPAVIQVLKEVYTKMIAMASAIETYRQLYYNPTYITTLFSRLQSNLELLVGTSANKSMQSALDDLSIMATKLDSRVKTLETSPAVDYMYVNLSKMNDNATYIIAALQSIAKTDVTAGTLVTHITNFQTQYATFRQGSINKTITPYVIKIMLYIPSLTQSMDYSSPPNIVLKPAYANLGGSLPVVLGLMYQYASNASMPDNIPVALGSLQGVVGNYAGSSTLSSDVAALATSLKTATDGIATLNTSTSDIKTKLDAAIADIANLKSNTSGTTTQGSDSTNKLSLSVAAASLPSSTIAVNQYAAFSVVDGVLSDGYPPKYVGYKEKTLMPISTLIDLATYDPLAISISYNGMYIDPNTPMGLNSSSGGFNIAMNSYSGLWWRLWSYYNRTIDPASTNQVATISPAAGVGTLTSLLKQQQSMDGSDLLKAISSAVAYGLKNKDGKLFIMELTFKVLQVYQGGIIANIATKASKPRMSTPYSASLTLDAIRSDKYGVPTIASDAMLDVSKFGIVVPNRFADNVYQSSTSVNTTTRMVQCPVNSYLCGMNFTVNTSSYVTDMIPRCCTFGDVVGKNSYMGSTNYYSPQMFYSF